MSIAQTRLLVDFESDSTLLESKFAVTQTSNQQSNEVSTFPHSAVTAVKRYQNMNLNAPAIS